MAAPIPTDQLRRHQPRPGPTSMKNGAARITVRRAVVARPKSSPIAKPRRSMLNACAVTVAVVRASHNHVTRLIRTQRQPDREHGQPDRHDVSLVPGRRVLRGVPERRAEGEEHGRAQAHRGRHRQAADHPPAQRHVDRGEDREQQLLVGREPERRDERDEQHRGERREGDQSAIDAIDAADRQHVLEEPVADTLGGRRDRVADRRLALQEGRRLPHEVIVDSGRRA